MTEVLYKNAVTIGAYLMNNLITDGTTDQKGMAALMTNYALICRKAFNCDGKTLSHEIATRYDELYLKARRQ